MSTDGTTSQPHHVTREVIGSYEVVRKLATGGMGEVYLAKQKGPVDFSRLVVLKKLHPKFTTDPHFVEMFLNEARIAANLAHPNIIHIYELFEDRAGYVIAMEYVRGGTVLALLRARQQLRLDGLPFGPAVRIATGVCDALHYAYNEPDEDGRPRHVIHRDVSPSNVIVGYDGHVKLVDFGIAKVLDMEGLTQATTIKGKYGYLSPEQVKCQPLDQRSDIFSLGTVLWEMTTGRRLFQRANDVQMMYAVVEESIPRPSERVIGYPRDLEEVVMKALARSREDRYKNSNELAQDLREVARNNGWDVDAAPLASLVREVLPEDHVAFGRTGSDSFQRLTSAQRETTGVSFADASSFASLEVFDPNGAAVDSRARTSWLALLVLVALSAAFWLVAVPRI